MNKIEEFIKKVMSDDGLKAKLTEILGGMDIKGVTKEQLSKVESFAKEHGFDISGELTQEKLIAALSKAGLSDILKNKPDLKGALNIFKGNK